MTCTCQNCGKHDRKMTKGRCQNCYRYWKRNGIERPLDVAILRSRTKQHVCVNCGAPRREGRNRRGAHGLCRPCYQFFWANGRMRTDADKIRSRFQSPGICTNCKQSTELFRGLCRACYTYKSLNGKRRPYRLFREECSNCKAPFNGYKPLKGRCRKCQQYVWDNPQGKERPAHLWGNNEHGWCDCGDGRNPVPATHTVTVAVGKRHTETFALCNECYAEHQRQVQWYGGGNSSKNTMELQP